MNWATLEGNKVENKAQRWGIQKCEDTMILNCEEIVGTLYGKGLQKANQAECRVKKVIKKKGNKLYVKWKGYHHSSNSW